MTPTHPTPPDPPCLAPPVVPRAAPPVIATWVPPKIAAEWSPKTDWVRWVVWILIGGFVLLMIPVILLVTFLVRRPMPRPFPPRTAYAAPRRVPPALIAPADFDSLATAIAAGDQERVDALLKQGANPNARNAAGSTPLHEAARKGDLAIAQLLLDHGAKKDTLDASQLPPFFYATNGKLLRLLRVPGRRVTPRIFSRDRVNALLAAISAGDEEKVATLLKDHPELADAEQDYIYHWTVLHEAAANGRLGITQLLLDADAEVNITNADGETPLLWATRNGHTEIVQLLLEHHANPNLADIKKKRTPLHEAAFRGLPEITALLLAQGANPNAQDKAGKLPLFYATDENHEEIIELLRKSTPSPEKGKE